ncbi:4a-hydroxytetrahydrobiopterin dehydratase [bacterium]|nr:4a-hydroxytetrahydrobiopterin dehydratase [bacterium]
MSFLKELKCVPCRGGEPPLSEGKIQEMKPKVPQWNIVERQNVERLERVFRFKNFQEALRFTNEVGKLAQEEEHHPKIVTQWGRVKVSWFTHKIKGLHKNDFIMAAKTNDLYKKNSF